MSRSSVKFKFTNPIPIRSEDLVDRSDLHTDEGVNQSSTGRKREKEKERKKAKMERRTSSKLTEEPRTGKKKKKKRAQISAPAGALSLLLSSL